MTFQELKFLIGSDLYRHTGEISLKKLLTNLRINPGFQYSFYMRLAKYAKKNGNFLLRIYAVLWLNHYTCKYGISIPYITDIGSGFYIGHFSGIFVNINSKIGKNCNISQGVTIGQANRGKNKGVPILGDHVYIGPGAKIIGNVRIGNNVAIGANAVVTCDVPDNAVVGGIPARIISYGGTEGYIEKTDYLC